jgi:ribosomal protein L16/L10AE
MGKGKGKIDSWVYPVYRGDILFELDFVHIFDAKRAFYSASKKLGLNLKFIYKKYD